MGKRRDGIPGRSVRCGAIIAVTMVAHGLIAGAARADEPGPMPQLGDPAPPLEIAAWVKGGPVSLEEGRGKTVFVLDFWTTWCSPCVASVPAFTRLQQKFRDKGVVVVGINNQDEGMVRHFAATMGDKMDYVVAADDAGKTFAAYGVQGVPQLFVIDRDGTVIFHGMGVEYVLPKVLAGGYDIAAAKRDAETLRELHVLADEYRKLAMEGADTAKADAIGETLLERSGAFPDILNGLAWAILTDALFAYRDRELALRAARAAYDATDGQEAAFVDTYALALFENGRVKKAVRLQKKVIAMVENDPLWREDAGLRAELDGRLERYQAKAKGKD